MLLYGIVLKLYLVSVVNFFLCCWAKRFWWFLFLVTAFTISTFKPPLVIIIATVSPYELTCYPVMLVNVVANVPLFRSASLTGF